MRKKFTDLTIGDIVYRVTPNAIEVREYPIEQINITRITIDSSEINREPKEIFKGYYRGYHTTYLFFANKEDAVRYSRAQCTKQLFAKISGLKKALNEAIEFKKEHYDLLNTWMEPDFDKLENEIKKL